MYEFFLNIGYVHEVFHYLPAWIFGLSPEMHKNYMTYDWDDKNKFRNIFVISGPIIVGVAGLSIAVCLWATRAETALDSWNYGSWVMLSVAWMITCLNDFYDLFDVLRYGTKTKRICR